MEIVHVPSEWRLFIDSSSKSLKAVLLHNDNKLPSIPLAHSKLLRESYDNTKLLLESIKYNEYKWDVIGDFKMIAFLMGMQGGNTKFPCFICHWDSREVKQHYIKQNWPLRDEFVEGQHNVKHTALVDPQKILMPPLHIKLGLMKQFVKALDNQSSAFQYLRKAFPKLSDAKVTAGVFTGPEIRRILNDTEFSENLNKTERLAWQSFKSVAENFLGNNRAANYRELIKTLIHSFQAMNCRMSLKVHMLHSHLDNFKNNMGAYSEEHGERFHQDIKLFEERYNRQCNEAMMGDYINSLIVDNKSAKYKRASGRKTLT